MNLYKRNDAESALLAVFAVRGLVGAEPRTQSRVLQRCRAAQGPAEGAAAGAIFPSGTLSCHQLHFPNKNHRATASGHQSGYSERLYADS